MPARDRGSACDFTPPSRAEFFCSRPSTLQPAEPPERHRVRVLFLASGAHALCKGKAVATRISRENRASPRFLARHSPIGTAA